MNYCAIFNVTCNYRSAYQEYKMFAIFALLLTANVERLRSNVKRTYQYQCKKRPRGNFRVILTLPTWADFIEPKQLRRTISQNYRRKCLLSGGRQGVKKEITQSLYQKPSDYVAPYAELDTIRRNYRTALTRSYNSFQSITFFPVIPDFIMYAQKKDAHELYMQLIQSIVI